MNKTSIVYCTTNKVNGKKYIGSHYGKSNDNYLGSGRWLKHALKKYGKENFTRQTLWEGDKEYMREMEEYWCEYFDVANNNLFYNLSNTGHGCAGHLDYVARNASIDWEAKVANHDYKTMFENMDFSNRKNNPKFSAKQMNTPEAIAKLHKVVIMLDDNNNIIKEWPSLKEAKADLKIDVRYYITGKAKNPKYNLKYK